MTRLSTRRRDFLAGIGAGSLFLLPFMKERVLKAQLNAQPGNLLIFFTPNGIIRDEFGAEGTGTEFQLRSSLTPLEQYKPDLALIRGLCCKSSSEKASHEDITRILTCRGDGADGSLPGNGDFDGTRAYGPSIDHAIATALSAPPPLTLGVGPGYGDSGNWENRLSWRQDGALVTQDPAQDDGRAVYTNLFQGLMPSADPAEVDYRLEQDQSVLDLVREDLATLKPRLSSEDRGHLEAYESNLRDIERRLADPLVSGGQCDPQLLAAANFEGTGDDIAKHKAQGELMIDLAAQAFACGRARTSTVQWGRATGGIDPTGTGCIHHNISHGECGGGETKMQIDRWYAERMAYTIEKLKEVGVFDNTIVVWISEISQEHNQNDYSLVLAGGKNLGVRLGQSILYPTSGNLAGRAAGREPGNRSLADLWVSVQNALGVDSPVFGEPAMTAGPLPELTG